jgi:hypothetical protein
MRAGAMNSQATSVSRLTLWDVDDLRIEASGNEEYEAGGHTSPREPDSFAAKRRISVIVLNILIDLLGCLVQFRLHVRA